MEELVMLIIFGVIILFNVVLKKLAGKAGERKKGDEPLEREAAAQGAGDAASAQGPPRDVREFIEEIKRRAEEARGGSGRTPQRYRQELRPVNVENERGEAGHVAGENSATAHRPDMADQPKKTTAAEKDLSKTHEQAAPPETGKKTPAPPGACPKRKKMERTPTAGIRFAAPNKAELRKAVVMSEVLGKPVGLRKQGRRGK